MAQLDTTNTFIAGDTVDAASMNNIIDQATAQTGIITAQTATGTVDPAADYVLVYDASVTALRKALVEKLPSGTTSIDFDTGYPQPTAIFSGNVSPTTGNAKITLSLKNQGANKVLAGPLSGSTTPSFRLLAPSDLPIATVGIAANAIDWSLGSCFTKTLTAATHNFTFSNSSEGQTIRVRLVQDATGGRHVNWATTPAVRWPGGVAPVMTPGLGRSDIYTFHYIGALYYGTFEQDFLL